MRYVLVGVGGFLGAVMRYVVGDVVTRVAGASFPHATLLINVSGSFFLGMVFQLSTERSAISPELRIFLAVGVLGAYTTFSTFSLETVQLMQEGALPAAVLNIVLSVAAALVAITLGMTAAKML